MTEQQREAMQAALAALETVRDEGETGYPATVCSAIALLDAALAQQEHGEPVAEVVSVGADHGGTWADCTIRPGHPVGTKLYTAPPPRKRLTDWQLGELKQRWDAAGTGRLKDFARAIESAHGIGDEHEPS